MHRAHLARPSTAALLLVAAVGCGGRAAPRSATDHGGPPAPPVCVAVQDVGLWQSELFPSCPPPPLPSYPLCDGAACARPCAAANGSLGMHGGTSRAAHVYDGDGHWTGATTEDGRTPYRCAWEQGRLDHCTGDDWREQAVRDERGRLVAIVRTSAGAAEARTSISRDAAGRIAAVGDRALRYRDDGRVVQAGDRTIDYDADGRIARTTDSRSVEVWTYDEQGRLVTVVSERRPPADAAPASAPPASPPPDEDDDGELLLDDDADAFEPERRTYAFRYDDRGRLSQALSLGAHEDASSGTSFEYECP